MKKLLEMIDIVKRQGSIPFLNNPNSAPWRPEAFFHFVEHCQPFVFSSKNKDPEEIQDPIQRPGDTFAEQYQQMIIESKYDSPFKIWSAEILGGKPITSPKITDHFQVFIEAFLAVEDEEGTIFFTLIESIQDGQRKKMVTVETKSEVSIIAKALVERLNSDKEQCGTEYVRERVKIGSGKSKRTITIRKIVHVRPKKSQPYKSESNREIEWTHRWWTRGHWRTIVGLGKDRDGNYTQENRTWVIEHVKGPEDAPLVNKTRMVKK